MRESGDLLDPVASGALDAAQVRDLASLLRDATVTRRNAEEITVFKAVGSAIADLAAPAAPSPPAVSRGTRVSLSLPAVNRASCAASSMALPSSALGPESGTSSATLTGPASARGGASGAGGGGNRPLLYDCEPSTGGGTVRGPAQAVSASSRAKAIQGEAKRGTRELGKDGLR